VSIPVEAFGHDHWSTFGYIETRIVDYGGIPRKEHLRCIHERHPFFAHSGGDASRYPTRLRGDQVKRHHDDWDCLDDIEAAGFIENVGTGLYRVYRLTQLGKNLAAKLRAHKADGGKWSEFFVGEIQNANVETKGT
jgi:hypothetical protein